MCAAVAGRLVSAVPFPEMGVFFVSREPVRDPGPIAAFARVRAALEKQIPGAIVPGSLSCVSKAGFVIASCPQGLGSTPETSLTEVYEYDPVRYQALVVGLVPAPADTPLHWIARKVNPGSAIVSVVDAQFAEKAKINWLTPPKGYLGNSQTLLAIGRMLRGQTVTALKGLGLAVAAKTPEALAVSISELWL